MNVVSNSELFKSEIYTNYDIYYNYEKLGIIDPILVNVDTGTGNGGIKAECKIKYGGEYKTFYTTKTQPSGQVICYSESYDFPADGKNNIRVEIENIGPFEKEVEFRTTNLDILLNQFVPQHSSDLYIDDLSYSFLKFPILKSDKEDNEYKSYFYASIGIEHQDEEMHEINALYHPMFWYVSQRVGLLDKYLQKNGEVKVANGYTYGEYIESDRGLLEPLGIGGYTYSLRDSLENKLTTYTESGYEPYTTALSPYIFLTFKDKDDKIHRVYKNFIPEKNDGTLTSELDTIIYPFNPEPKKEDYISGATGAGVVVLSAVEGADKASNAIPLSILTDNDIPILSASLGAIMVGKDLTEGDFSEAAIDTTGIALGIKFTSMCTTTAVASSGITSPVGGAAIGAVCAIGYHLIWENAKYIVYGKEEENKEFEEIGKNERDDILNNIDIYGKFNIFTSSYGPYSDENWGNWICNDPNTLIKGSANRKVVAHVYNTGASKQLYYPYLVEVGGDNIIEGESFELEPLEKRKYTKLETDYCVPGYIVKIVEKKVGDTRLLSSTIGDVFSGPENTKMRSRIGSDKDGKHYISFYNGYPLDSKIYFKKGENIKLSIGYYFKPDHEPTYHDFICPAGIYPNDYKSKNKCRPLYCESTAPATVEVTLYEYDISKDSITYKDSLSLDTNLHNYEDKCLKTQGMIWDRHYGEIQSNLVSSAKNGRWTIDVTLKDYDGNLLDYIPPKVYEFVVYDPDEANADVSTSNSFNITSTPTYSNGTSILNATVYSVIYRPDNYIETINLSEISPGTYYASYEKDDALGLYTIVTYIEYDNRTKTISDTDYMTKQDETLFITNISVPSGVYSNTSFNISVEIKNNRSEGENITLNFMNLAGAEITCENKSVYIAENTTGTFEISCISQLQGSYSGLVVISNDTGEITSAPVDIEILPVPLHSIETELLDYGDYFWLNETKIEFLQVTNTGDFNETLNLTIISSSGWNVSASSETISLNVGERKYINLTINASSNNSENGNLTFILYSGAEEMSKINKYYFVREPQAIINIDPEEIDWNVPADETINFSVRIYNNGIIDSNLTIIYINLTSENNETILIELNRYDWIYVSQSNYSELNVTTTIPYNATGEYRAGIGFVSEDNDTYVLPITFNIYGVPPDLKPTDISHQPLNPIEGQNLTITCEIGSCPQLVN
ncbi:hypothetical protein BEH94_02220 [Candidatus Altiarchaeales archaeon WOR_SM1_SCG]|nr:hypothetical protein BEH94_02220 [Candidatus Altiarchaeales archaeon WOR_SM1_SCG]